MARTRGHRITKTLNDIHSQSAAIDRYVVKRNIVRLALGSNRRCCRLIQILVVGPIADDGREAIGRKFCNIGGLDLGGNRAGLA